MSKYNILKQNRRNRLDIGLWLSESDITMRIPLMS